MLRTLCLLLIALFFAPLWAQNTSENISAGDVPSLSQLNELKDQVYKLKEQNKQKAIQVESLTNTINTPLSSERSIKEEELSQTYIELEQARLQVDNLQNELSNLEQNLQNTKKRNNDLNSLLQKQSNPLSDSPDNQERDLIHTRQLLERNQAFEQVLSEQKELLSNALLLAERQRALLETRYRRYNERYLELQDNNPDQLLNNKVRDRVALLEQTREQLSNKLTRANLDRLTRLDLNIELAMVIKQLFSNSIWQDYLSIERRLQDLQFVDFSSVSLSRIENVQNEINLYHERITNMAEQLQRNFSLITEQYSLYKLQRTNIPQPIETRYKEMSNRYQSVISSLENANLSIEIISEQINQQFTLMSKNHLTKHYNILKEINDISTLSKELITANSLFAGQYLVAINTFYQQLQKFSTHRWLVFGGLSSLIIIIVAILTGHMNYLVRRKRKIKRLPFATRLLLFILGMLKYNLPYIGLLCLVWLALTFTQLTSPSYELLLLPPVILLMICIPYFSATILINTELLKTADDRRIVRPIIFISTMGSILFALVIMAQMTLDDSNTINVFRWLFGLYILAISWPFAQMVKRSIDYLDEYYQDFLSYRILRIVIAILPLSTAIFGIASVSGYLNFAWVSARYILYFVLFAILWVSIIALLKDASLWAKRYALQNTQNGLFWAQDVITPLHTVLRYGSLFILATLLFKLYNWNDKTPFIQDALNILNTPLFQGKEESQFTLRNILLMGLLFYFVFRIGGWIRSFSYRWIYSKVLDLGIRNSLAVFSQYAVVTIGFLLALRVIGLDLTAFTVFAGALGVGIGFGMQNIANNFISGILLLIERPLRNGDIISVGNYFGTVERIGMRSLTMTTFDNEALILPNSDFVTSAFINWTHTDRVVRLSLYLDLDYSHNPAEVTRLLNQTMQRLLDEDKIISEGELISAVYAHEYSDRGTTYRIIFYLDIDKHGYIDTRDIVIAAIWQACYDNNLQIAYPKRDLFFPSSPQQLGQLMQNHPQARPNLLDQLD